MPSDSITCVGYVRVSTERQAGEVLTSLSDQETAISELAVRLGVEVGHFFRDAGASGATVEGRPAFRDLLRFCEANPQPPELPGHILALNDSRWGRFPEPEESAYWRHHLRRLGWIVRLAEGDEVDGDFRTVVRAIGSVQASEYRRNLVANTRRGMRGAAEQGFWTRRAPFGYRRKVVHPPSAERVLEPSQRKVDGEKVRLTPHRGEAQLVRWIFERYAAGGESLGSLASQLKRQTPGKQWSRTVLCHLLRNEVYLGHVVGGRRGSTPYRCENAHPAIVPADLWQAAQRRLDANARRGPGVRTHYLLTGLLTCVHCGEAYTGGGGGRSRSKNPARRLRRHYRCNGGVTGACPGPIGTVSRHLVDDAVVELIGETITTPAAWREIERAMDTALESAGSIGDTDADLRAARARQDQRRARLVAAVADGTLLQEEAGPELERIRRSVAELEARGHAARFARKRAKGARAEREHLLELARDFPAIASRVVGPKLRELVAPWLGEATFDKVTRELVIGIRPLPASFVPTSWPGPDSP